MRKLYLAILLAGFLSAAELENNTVTVTASRPISVPPDQVSIYVELRAEPGAGLDEVVGKLKGAGITAANLSNVYGSGLTSQWIFHLPVSFPALKAKIAMLTRLQDSLGSFQNSRVLTFSVTGTEVSAEARAAQPCPLPALVSDARRQADALAAAASMRTGVIVSVSDEPPAAVIAVQRTGDYFGVLPVIAGTFLPLVSVVPVVPSSCSLTVQFKLVP